MLKEHRLPQDFISLWYDYKSILSKTGALPKNSQHKLRFPKYDYRISKLNLRNHLNCSHWIFLVPPLLLEQYLLPCKNCFQQKLWLFTSLISCKRLHNFFPWVESSDMQNDSVIFFLSPIFLCFIASYLLTPLGMGPLVKC